MATEQPIPDQSKASNKKVAPKPPFNPYDVIIVGLDDHPDISADFRANPSAGISKEDAELRRKLYVQLFDERAFEKPAPERVATTRKFGIQVPVKYITFRGSNYCVDGRQRLLCARVVYDEQVKLGIEDEYLIKVPGDKYTGDINTIFAASRAMNVHVSDPPMRKARAMTRLLMEDVVDAPGETPRKRTVAEVAAIFGCSDQHVRDMIKLFESPDTVKKALEELKQPTIALLMTSLTKEDGSPDEEKQMKVLQELKDEANSGTKLTVDRARKKVAEARGKTANSPKDKVDTIQRLLQKLADKSQEMSCTNCKNQAEYQAALVTLLGAVDGIARAAFAGGKIAFPTPINKQVPGYTLDVIAKTGD